MNKNKNEKNTSRKNILKEKEYLVTWLGLILTFVSIFILNNKVNNVLSYYSNISNQVENESYQYNDISDSLVMGDNNSDISLNVDKSISSEIMSMLYMGDNGNYYDNALKYAECYYSMHEFNTAFNIYYMLNLEELENEYYSSVIKNNLGYMYANGLGCTKDYTKAITLYDEAIILSCEKAMSNKVALYFKEHSNGLDEKLIEAIRENNKYVNAFVISNVNQYSLDEFVDLLQSVDKKEIMKFVNNYFYEEENVGTEKLTSAPTSDVNNRYEKVGAYNWDDENGLSGTVYLYNHYKLKCRNIDIIDAGIIYSFENN